MPVVLYPLVSYGQNQQTTIQVLPDANPFVSLTMLFGLPGVGVYRWAVIDACYFATDSHL